MKKLIEKIGYWAGILTLGIVVGVSIKVVGAWVEPNQMPPGGNIAAPLNTGNIGQSKQGGLTLNIGGATYGLIVDKGLVGIKTTTPQADLDVNGDIRAHNLNLNNNLNVGGDANINGNLNINGTLSNSFLSVSGYENLKLVITNDHITYGGTEFRTDHKRISWSEPFSGTPIVAFIGDFPNGGGWAELDLKVGAMDKDGADIWIFNPVNQHDFDFDYKVIAIGPK